MTRRTLATIGDFFDVFGSAVAVSRALERRHQPNAHDLRKLGIDPVKFRNIHLY